MIRSFRCIIVAAVICTNLVVTGYAQQITQQPPEGVSANLRVASSRIAIIFTDFFYDPGSGINRILSALNLLDQELQPRKAEVLRLQQRIEQLINETSGLAPRVTPTISQAKLEELERLKIELQRKAEDIQTDYRKRRPEKLNPIFEDLDKAIKSFAQQRRITLIFDGSKMDDAILYMSEDVDLTRPFITEFNRANAADTTASPK